MGYIFDIKDQQCCLCDNKPPCKACGVDQIYISACRNIIIDRLNKNEYPEHRTLMKGYLLDTFGYDYDLESSKVWHPCRMPDEFGHLEHDGTWVPGRWYEWLDMYGNTEVARMKADAWDHFFPGTKTIKEEDVIAFRDIPRYPIGSNKKPDFTNHTGDDYEN